MGFSFKGNSQTYGGAYSVDGSYSEWNLTNDYFADMYRAFNNTKKVESKLYLHYDCQNQVMYALVLTEAGVPGVKIAADAWITINGISNKVVTGSSGNNGTAPDFNWIGVGFDGNTDHVLGYEASFPLAEGDYKIVGHIEVYDDGANQTSGTIKDQDGVSLHVECPVIPTLDLAVVKSVNDATPDLGQNVVFTITVSNLSTDQEATNVILTDILPSGLNFVSANPSTGSFSQSTGAWSIASLPASGSATLELTTEVILVDPLCNEVSITGLDQIDTNSSNNTSEACVDVPDLDLEVLKSVDNDQPYVNDQVTFTITVNNLSTVTGATEVVITDLLPSGLDFISYSASAGTYDGTSGKWEIDDINPGATVTLQVVVKVTAQDPVCNKVSLTSLNEVDKFFKNDEDEVCLDIKKKELDLAVNKTVYNAVPALGEMSIFTVTVTNNSPVLTATNVVITDLLPNNLVYQSNTASSGTYESSTGEWSLSELAPAGTATLTITVKVNGSADNTACLTSLDQTDTNSSNNCSTVSVTVSGSSGGNEGGLESNGDLAGLIALRNYNRARSDEPANFKSASTMVTFTEELAGMRVIKPASILKSGSDLVDFLPETGPFKSRAFVSTPSDLIGISNAKEVISLDYFSENDTRYGAVLGLTTTGGEVYNHTKLICDRLMGASMEMAMNVTIHNRPFILTKLVQENGETDYAVTFIAWSEASGMMIDNRWHNEEYKPADGSSVYNFQVWSVTIQSTIDLVSQILDRMESRTSVTYLNTQERKIPMVRVISGSYRNGNLILKLDNSKGAEEITVKGTLTRTEQSDREPFTVKVAINPNKEIQEVEVPVGTIYDAGINIGNNLNSYRDALYFADGSWGIDYTENGAVVSDYTVTDAATTANADELSLERNVSISGQVKNYISVFRGMKAGSRPVDASEFNALQFRASGVGHLQVVVTKSSIDGWSDQFRTQVALNAETKEYTLRFEDFTSSLTGRKFTGEDVESVVFSLIGNGSDWTPVSLEVSDLKFANVQKTFNELSMEDYLLNVYPNPVRTQASLSFELPEDGRVLITLLDAAGRQVGVVADREFNSGPNVVDWNSSSIDSGLYLVKMNYKEQQIIKRLLKE
jgi:uncharacterized repeat protein (TIGR01451 family)